MWKFKIMKTIIFDIDGTIFDTKKGIIDCLNDVLECFGARKISNEKENNYIGPAVKDSLMKFNKFSERIADQATIMYREKYVSNYVLESMPYDGLLDLLNYLRHKGYQICIATMKTRTQVDKLLEIYHIKDFFDCIETASDQGGYSKFDMLKKIKGKYPNNELLFVGDTKGDYLASKEAGIAFIYAEYGYGIVNGDNFIRIKQLENVKVYV